MLFYLKLKESPAEQTKMSISDTRNSECSSFKYWQKKNKQNITSINYCKTSAARSTTRDSTPLLLVLLPAAMVRTPRCILRRRVFRAGILTVISLRVKRNLRTPTSTVAIDSFNQPSSSRRLRRTNPAARCRPPGRPSGRWPPRTARTG